MSDWKTVVAFLLVGLASGTALVARVCQVEQDAEQDATIEILMEATKEATLYIDSPADEQVGNLDLSVGGDCWEACTRSQAVFPLYIPASHPEGMTTCMCAYSEGRRPWRKK